MASLLVQFYQSKPWLYRRAFFQACVFDNSIWTFRGIYDVYCIFGHRLHAVCTASPQAEGTLARPGLRRFMVGDYIYSWFADVSYAAPFKLPWNTVISEFCIFLLWGMFIGYTAAIEYTDERKREQSTALA